MADVESVKVDADAGDDTTLNNAETETAQTEPETAQTEPETAQPEIETEENMIVDAEMAVDNDSEVVKPEATSEDTVDDNTIKEDELVLVNDTSFEADVMDEEGDDDDGEELHEGDGEHEDKKDEAMDEDDDEEEDDDSYGQTAQDPNVLPQVNVTVLAQRKWQVKVYPLKPADFTNGQISRVFKHARESLLYLQSPGKNARGKGEMYVSSANQAARCVLSLMRIDFSYPEVNVEIIRKNEEGNIEEKAYLRFDSKLTQILTLPVRRGPGNRKRDRMIGSVFLKNLPQGTTKDTLRVMFPFAQEINYNPEKFKECTARLVLAHRSHVIPCLKTFAKVELGDNVLELYPLTKRKRTRTDEDGDVSEAKQRKTSDDPKEETEKNTDGNKSEAKKPPVKKNVPNKNAAKEPKRFFIKPGPVKDKHNEEKAKHPPQKASNQKNRQAQTKTASKFFHQRRDRDVANRPKLVGGRERNSMASTAPTIRGGKPATRGRGANNRPRQDRSPASSIHSYRSERTNRDFRSPSAHSVGSNRNSRLSRGGGSSDRVGRQSQGGLGRPGSVASGYSLGGLSASDTSLAVNAEATKEMMLLQNQLGMAIKNQLAMLNQTTMAVEQAKRGLGSAADLQSTASLLPRQSLKGLSGAGRRSIDQYRPASSLDDIEDHYVERERARPKVTATRQGRGSREGGGIAGYNKGGASGYGNIGGKGGAGTYGNIAGKSAGAYGNSVGKGAGGYGSGLGKGGAGAGSYNSSATKGGAGGYGNRGGKGSGAGGYRGNKGGAAGGFSNRGGKGAGGYGNRSATSGYRDEVDTWDSGRQSSLLLDPYAQDYSYEEQETSSRNLSSSFGSSSRLYDYAQDGGYSGYY